MPFFPYFPQAEATGHAGENHLHAERSFCGDGDGLIYAGLVPDKANMSILEDVWDHGIVTNPLLGKKCVLLADLIRTNDSWNDMDSILASWRARWELFFLPLL